LKVGTITSAVLGVTNGVPRIGAPRSARTRGPTRKITTLSRMRRTDEFVTCDCVQTVHAAYAAPTRNDAALTGRKIRSGLKIVITLRRMRRNCTPSDPRRMFDAPCRLAASTGSKRTL